MTWLPSFVSINVSKSSSTSVLFTYEPTAGYNPSTDDLESNIFAAAYQQLLRVLWNTAVR